MRTPVKVWLLAAAAAAILHYECSGNVTAALIFDYVERHHEAAQLVTIMG
jgi:hypothetical protein